MKVLSITQERVKRKKNSRYSRKEEERLSNLYQMHEEMKTELARSFNKRKSRLDDLNKTIKDYNGYSDEDYYSRFQ